MDANEYDSLDQMRSGMSMARCPNPEVYHRDNDVQLLRSWPEVLRWSP